MGSLLSRSVEIQISNKTRNFTLKNPRTYFECGSCSEPLWSRIRPHSTGTCCFQGSFPFWGVAGILVYEAESFTLAIYFSNPIDYMKFSMELGLELSLSKVHLGRMANIYARMAKGSYSSSCQDFKFVRVIVDESNEIIQLSEGPVKVTATMSCNMASTLKVVLEEQLKAEEAKTEAP